MNWTEAEYAAYVAQRMGNTPSQPADEAEATFQARIIRLAKQHGWLCHHSHDSRRNEWNCDAGLPDLLLVRESIIFAELKTRTGKLTAEQERWLAMLSRAGQETYVWRPADWPLVEARLTQPWKEPPHA